jgi:general secretion pathway protein B
MSYILDALRKAERERHLGQPPSLTVPPLAAEPRRPRLGLWLGAGLGLGLNVALLAFFLTRPPPATPPPDVTALPAPAASAPSTPPAVGSLPAASAGAKAAATRQEPAGKSVTLEPPRPTAPPAGRERRETPARPLVIPGSVTLAPAPEPVPALETLPAGARRGIPALNLDIHSHSADPDKRFVVINGQRYREGERLGEGPVLETVTRDGAILRQGGQRFRLPVRR